jgi:hypothetical protein
MAAFQESEALLRLIGSILWQSSLTARVHVQRQGPLSRTSRSANYRFFTSLNERFGRWKSIPLTIEGLAQGFCGAKRFDGFIRTDGYYWAMRIRSWGIYRRIFTLPQDRTNTFRTLKIFLNNIYKTTIIKMITIMVRVWTLIPKIKSIWIGHSNK